MRAIRIIITIGFMAAAVLSGGAGVVRADITVFAAASLKDALDAVVVAFGGGVVVSYGGSAILARQVALGAPADVVILANAQWMDWLAEDGAIDTEQRIDLLGNDLVVVGPVNGLPMEAADLVARLGDGRLAIGQTSGVPAGIYGRAWLEFAGVWDDVKGRLAEVENVRVALALVARGEVPLGVTYASDARAEPRVSVVYEVPSEAHPAITYPAAVTGPEGAEFLAFLASQQAGEIFRTYGFKPLMEASWD